MSTHREEAGEGSSSSSSSSRSHHQTTTTNSDALVEATLIRDADEGSNSSSHHYYYYDNPITIMTTNNDHPVARPVEEASSAAFTVVVEAKPVHDENDVEAAATTKISTSRKLICVVMVVLLAIIAALGVGFVVSAQRQEDASENGNNNNNTQVVGTPTAVPISADNNNNNGPNSMSPTVTPIPVLQRLANNRDNATLHCGVLPGPGLFYFEGNDTETPRGLDASLCAAVAAAATGDPQRVEYNIMTFGTIMPALLRGEIDIISAGVTHTMDRQIYHEASGSGFAFTVPYLYQGMQLAGVPKFVECGDQGLEGIASCGDIRVCVVENSTHEKKLSSSLPGRQLIAVKSRVELPQGLRENSCNVIAHEGYNLAESLVREAGYEGEYMVGKTLFSKEPLAMLTAPHDPRFSDFANSVLQSLFVAEANNITQSTADQFDQTMAFGESYTDMFRHAVAAGGNYGELYSRFLEPYSPRQGLNMINYGHDTSVSGLMYSHPFGSIPGAQRVAGDTLSAIEQRGVLRCGIRPNRPGFAVVEADGSARGMEVDYCIAFASTILGGNRDAIIYVELESEEDGFAQLASGALDILTGATGNLLNNVNAPGGDEGFTFAQPYFYSANNNNTRDTVGEENLCVAVKEGDHLWSSFVYWISAGIIYAEENNITQGSSNNMPDVFLFGTDFTYMFQDVILAVGNYGEIFERNLEAYIPRSSRNLLNGNAGPQLYPLPGLMQ